MEKQQSMISLRVIISGGGTGGHIYPAIAIADEIKRKFPKTRILFVGANGKMEMEKVPKSGYKIKGLKIEGFNRDNLFKNILLPFKLIQSLFQAYQIITDFKPHVVIGTGGYASGPTLLVASLKGISYYIQEQNSYPGKTNKFLGKKAKGVFVAYDGLEKYFPKNKIHQTGNPIRTNLFLNVPNQEEAKQKFGLDKEKFTILSLGGSQGARALNDAWIKSLSLFRKSKYQLIWQTGTLDFRKIKKYKSRNSNNITVTDFIYNMQDAYAAADLIISRAGAIAISELMLIGKPCIFIPLPSAAEDHQTKNCMQLIEKDAAIMVKNMDAKTELFLAIDKLAHDVEKQKTLSENLKALAKPNATEEIVRIIFRKYR